MLKKTDKTKSYIFFRRLYILIYIFIMVQRTFGPREMVISPAIDTLMVYPVIAFGVGLILFDLFYDKILFRSPNIIWLCLFIISVSISSLLNIKYGILGNINSIIILSIEVFVFYAIDFRREGKDVRKEIWQVEHLVIIIWFIGVLLSLVMFLLQFYYYHEFSDGRYIRMGVVENRLFGVFTDPNYASVISVVVLIFLIKNFLNYKKTSIRIFYILNMLFQFIYIILSGSRTAEVSLSIMILLLSFFSLRYIFYVKSVSKIKNVFLSIGMSVIILIIVAALYLLLKKGLAYLPSLFSNVGQTEKIMHPVSFKRSDVEDSTDISNLRFKIWGSAIELFKSRPLFGVSMKHILPYAQDNFPLGFIAKSKYICHSLYINTLTCSGIIGFTLFFGFIIKSIITTLKAIFTVTNKEQYFNILYSCLPLVVLLCSGFFLNDIIFVNTLGAIIFWVYLGYTMYFVNGEKPYTETSIPYRIADKLTSKIKSVFFKNK